MLALGALTVSMYLVWNSWESARNERPGCVSMMSWRGGGRGGEGGGDVLNHVGVCNNTHETSAECEHTVVCVRVCVVLPAGGG